MGMTFTLVMLLGCIKENSDKVSEINMSVSSQTGIMYDLFDTDRQYPMECMLVMVQGGEDVWQTLPFGAVEGFVYQRGHEYELRVRRTILANPPLDGSDRTYSLIRILYDRTVSESEQPDEKEINTEADIEYYDMCPVAKYGAEPEIAIDGSGNMYHSDGTRMPSYDSAFIYVDNILDKNDPDWVKLNKVPYMWTYSFVLSPLAEQVRTIRNATNGIMVKELITPDEMAHITGNLKAGDELHYAFVAANVYKYGIQKLEITVKRID